MNKTRRFLVLTSHTGYAHNAAANAIKAWGEFLYGEQVSIEIEYLLENSNKTYAKLVNLYNFIQRNLPWLHNIYYLILEWQEPLLQNTRPGGIFVGKKYWVRKLENFRPDVIISTHCQTNLGYFALARQVLGNSVTCVTYCTEIDGGCGFTHNWIDPKVDIFWSQTLEVRQQALKMKLQSEQIFDGGTLLTPNFYQPPLTDSEKKEFLEKTLNLQAHRFTILLGTGGAGANNHLAFLEKLLSFKEQIQVIALCGKNVNTLQTLQMWKQAHPNFYLCPLSFTDQMASLLQVSSVIVARPGARTAIESLHCGCPMIFNLLGGAMPQEFLAMRYFKKKQIYQGISCPHQLPPLLKDWLDNPMHYQGLMERVQDSYQVTAPEKIMRAFFQELSVKSFCPMMLLEENQSGGGLSNPV